ncbi:MAG: hypothetical protein PHU04_03120 [Candidatus Peribacteraceae bacterium]|nr:hypothetical protein [Candidatus Peribacteraceae bacterium]
MRSFSLRAIGFLTGILVPAACHAQGINPCITSLTCTSDLAGHFRDAIVNNLILAFGGFLFAALVFYSIKLAAESRKDSAMTEAMTAYLQVFAGATIVLGAYVITQSFGTEGVIDPVNVEQSILTSIVTYIVQLTGAVLLLNIVVQGIRLLLSTDEGSMTAARGNLIRSFIGAALVMLGAPVLQMVAPGSFNHGINQEIVGIANFLGVLFGILAVVAIIVAGILLIVSVNESLKDKAKSIIISSLVAVVIIALSLGLIQVLLPA